MFFGAIKLIGFVLIYFFKKEVNEKKMTIESERVKMEELHERIRHNTIAKSYKGIIDMFRVKPMLQLIIVFVTIRVSAFFLNMNSDLYIFIYSKFLYF
jgi:hypothetical protein